MSFERIAKHHIIVLSLIFVFIVFLSTEAQAELYGFNVIAPTNWGSSSTLAAQLSVEVTDPGSNQVLFTFNNNLGLYAVTDPLYGAIGTVFFDDGALLEIAAIQNDSANGVNFEIPPDNPESKNLPGGNTLVPPFQTSAHFWSSADNLTAGVEPGEYVGILFNLKGGKTFADVITAIDVGFNPDLYYTDGSWDADNLRIGMHVQRLGEDNQLSDAFIMTPVPGAVLLGLLGMTVAGVKLRKFA